MLVEPFELKPLFPTFTDAQFQQLAAYQRLLLEWNPKVNLVSRQDVAHFTLHHLLHSLLLAKIVPLEPGIEVIDAGTGGGLPGLPLAIAFPRVRFTLVDSIAKKMAVLQTIVEALELPNVVLQTGRIEQLQLQADFVLGRAVRALPEFLRWTLPLIRPGCMGSFAHGVLYFKGTRLWEELEGFPGFQAFPLQAEHPDPFFQDKYLVHIPASSAQGTFTASRTQSVGRNPKGSAPRPAPSRRQQPGLQHFAPPEGIIPPQIFSPFSAHG